MAVWQFMKSGKPMREVLFDDGLAPTPGDEGFSTDIVEEALADAGADNYNYVGLTTIVSQEE